MHRTIGYLSKQLVQIRTGEWRKVFLTFLYFFLVITAYYVIKPVSRSLILGDLGSRLVPYVDLISAILMGPVVTLFARLVDRIEKRRLVSLSFFAVTAILVVFWQLLQWPAKWVAAVFYLWVSIFSVLVVTLFWLVANDLYRPREAKRLFGFIGSGGILGGIVGSSIAAVGARLIGTDQLLLVSASLLGICWLVVQRLWRYAPGAWTLEQVASPLQETFLSNLASFVRLLLRSRYLLLLIGLVGIAKIISTFIYYQFNPFIEQMFPETDAKTAFMGLFLGWMNVVAFVVQFFFTSWILRRLGLLWALCLLPAGLLVGSMGLLLIPAFWLAATVELSDGSLNYSLQQTTKEVLYLPIDRTIRYKVKPFIDMVVFRFGKGLAALCGIFLLDVLGLEARTLSYLAVPLIVGWLILAIQLRRDYVTTIRGILQARAASRRSQKAEASRTWASHLPAVELDAALESLVQESPAQQKLELASQLIASNGSLVKGGQQLLEALADYEQRASQPEPWESMPFLDRLKECLADRHQPMSVRRYAIKQLVQLGGQEAVDCLLGMLMVEEDTAMRQELLRGLTKLRLRDLRLEFPKRPIRRQITKEVQAYQRMAQVAVLYRRFCPHATPQTDPCLGLLRLLMEETVQQIFRCLSLLHRPEDIYLIYNQLREPDRYVRADAVELLDNLIDPAMRWVIFPILDEDQFLERAAHQLDEPALESEATTQFLRETFWDHNRWLSVLIVCLIGRLRITPLLRELDRVAQSQAPLNPLVSLAAQVARRIAAEPRPFGESFYEGEAVRE